MKTHLVIDMTIHEDEGNQVFLGTENECHDWIESQGSFGYEVKPLTEEEFKRYNEVCQFNMAWIGKCGYLAVDHGMCEKHKDLKCSSCGNPATHSCSETGQFVCGAPLCDECEHTTAMDGTNGNIGFFRTSDLPKGMKEHCKKSEQRAFSWIIKSAGKDYPEIQAILNKFDNGELSYLNAEKQINEFMDKKISTL